MASQWPSTSIRIFYSIIKIIRKYVYIGITFHIAYSDNISCINTYIVMNIFEGKIYIIKNIIIILVIRFFKSYFYKQSHILSYIDEVLL
jgi:hypothetical protein